MIYDFDVHHGNGTNDVFLDDPSVLFISSHQAGSYPGTGKVTEAGMGDGEGATINVPLPGKPSVLLDVLSLPRIIPRINSLSYSVSLLCCRGLR